MSVWMAVLSFLKVLPISADGVPELLGEQPPGGLVDRGFNYTYPYNDSAYDLGLDTAFQNIPHTGDTLTVEWFADGAGWQGINALFGNTHDESWAIDNVSITLNGASVPLPPAPCSFWARASWGWPAGGGLERVNSTIINRSAGRSGCA